MKADLADGVFVIGQQVAGEPDALAGNVFQRSEPKLFSKPAEENIATEIGLFAEGVYGDVFGEVVMDVLQHEVEAAAIAITGGAFCLVVEVLALEDADQELLEAQVRIDIFGDVRAGADTDELVDEAGDIGIVVEVILIEV